MGGESGARALFPVKLGGSLVNLGLIGAGRIGRLHARHLAHRISRARLVVIADVLLRAAQACASENDVKRAVVDYRTVLDDPSVDAVVVCSATDTHAQIIEDAAAAGKHVFCEKPIDLSLERTDAALAAVRRAGVTLQIGFNRRFDANSRRVRAAVVDGEVGQPWRLHIVSRDPAPPPLSYIRTSGGLFVDMAIHDFDMARFLIGAEVEVDEIFATTGVLVDPQIGDAGDVDTAVTVMRFANGVIGTIDNSRRAVYGYDQRIEILGSGGMIGTSNNYESNAVVSDGASVRRDLPLNFFLERYAQSYIDEISAFVDCVADGRIPPVTGEDGRAALVLAFAAERSARLRRPVSLTDVS
jgi:myo-inositol 2-dehydrogenase/D-chiro-inositol 1-dehydrogenase